MNTIEQAGNTKRCTIRLIGLEPGTREEDVAAALVRLYPGKTAEQVGQVLKKLPAVLTTSATEETARKVHAFLKPKGAVLKITYTAPAPAGKAKAAGPVPAAEKEPAPPPAAREEPPPKKEPSGIERRVKPRVHPGIQIHPMAVGEILDRSFRLLREHFWLFFLIVFIPQCIYFLVSHGGALLLGGAAGGEPSVGMGIGFGVSAVIATLIFIVIQFWAQGALIHAVSENYLGHSTSVGNSYGSVRKRLGRLLGTMILMGVLVLLGPFLAGVLAAVVMPILAMVAGPVAFVVGVLVGIGILWLTIRLFLNWLLADKVVVLEDEAWMSALRRSKELMNARTEEGYWKRPKNKAALILLAGFLIGLGIHLLFQVPGFALGFLQFGFVAAAVSGLLNIISTSLATVFTATAMILFYYDIRLRKEGFDLKMMAQGLG
jgi:MFS family permease